MAQNPPRICSVEPFVADVTPQPGSLEEASTAGSIFQKQIEDYLNRLREALCDDIQEIIDDCCPTGLSP